MVGPSSAASANWVQGCFSGVHIANGIAATQVEERVYQKQLNGTEASRTPQLLKTQDVDSALAGRFDQNREALVHCISLKKAL